MVEYAFGDATHDFRLKCAQGFLRGAFLTAFDGKLDIPHISTNAAHTFAVRLCMLFELPDPLFRLHGVRHGVPMFLCFRKRGYIGTPALRQPRQKPRNYYYLLSKDGSRLAMKAAIPSF